MPTATGTYHPDLIDAEIGKKLNRVIQYQQKKIKEATLSYKLTLFYNQYIIPNKYIVLLLFAIIAFFYYKYYIEKKPIINTNIIMTAQSNQPKKNIVQKINNLTAKALTLKPCGHTIKYPCICNVQTDPNLSEKSYYPPITTSQNKNMSENINDYMGNNQQQNNQTFNYEKVMNYDHSQANQTHDSISVNDEIVKNYNYDFYNAETVPNVNSQIDSQYPKSFNEPYKQWPTGEGVFRSFETPFKE
jgi:hypothetical protein